MHSSCRMCRICALCLGMYVITPCSGEGSALLPGRRGIFSFWILGVDEEASSEVDVFLRVSLDLMAANGLPMADLSESSFERLSDSEVECVSMDCADLDVFHPRALEPGCLASSGSSSSR